ncbi:MAG: hypothetical protein ISR76_10185 [Planctomycetes bacterium]|nr:hypothetical protein [Planctomycetota bacterium]
MKSFLMVLAVLALASAPACTGPGSKDLNCCDAAAAKGEVCAECAAKAAEMKQCCKDAAALGKECEVCAEKK